ncbi:MAG: hypothetical protein ACFB03_23070 [Paracoccaceae bacterium]
MANDRPPFQPDQTPDPAEIPRKAADEPPGWTDNKTTVKLLNYALFAFAILLLLIDPLVHKHGPFEIEHVWGFYGLYPLAACVAVLVVARVLGAVLRRAEDYYDR